MRVFKCFCSVCLVLTLLLSLCLPASAAGEPVFSDVPEDHEYYQAVNYMAESGISNGLSDGWFGVDENISMRALCTFAMRAFMPDLAGSGSDAFDVLLGLQCVPEYASVDMPVDFATGLLILGRASGILPAGDDSVADYTVQDVFRYVRDVGAELDVMDIRGKISTQRMTRGDAAYIIYSISQWLASDAARDLTHVEKYGFGYIDIQATSKYTHLLPQLYSSVLRLPFQTLKTFHDLGYHVLADNEHIDMYNKEHAGFTAVALFSKSGKTIWTTAGHSLPHEMGHFTQYVIMNDRTGIESYFEAEKDNLSSLVSKYAKQDSGEFFAEFFGVYHANQDNAENLDKLKSDMPKTFDYFEKLNEANWLTDKSEQVLSAALICY